jgi:hypothetical protein
MNFISQRALLVVLMIIATHARGGPLAGLLTEKADRAVPKTSVSTDVSDVWWNPNESGWGMQLVQSDATVFATIFVYGTDNRPTWFTAQLAYDGTTTFTGPLYATTGPGYAGPFNSSRVSVRQAGTMSFHLLSVSTATLSYTVDGVPISKNVQRQSLALENFIGDYVTAVNLTQTGCFSAAENGTYNGAMELFIVHNATGMAMTWSFDSGWSCSFGGSYSQAGHLGIFDGTYSCNNGEAGAMRFFEMTNRRGMVSGRLTGKSSNAGCSYAGRFTGLNPYIP